jgi:CelD/BcsL family acetyltransferase involved in cellulose biosynthesis
VAVVITDNPGSARTSARRARFAIDILQDWTETATRWDWSRPTGEDASFQDQNWLRNWYGAFAHTDIEPLIAIVSDAATGERIALLPLIRRREHRIRIVEFADLDLTDYNAPLLTKAARDPAFAKPMWKALRKALRRSLGGADLIRLRKMPLTIDGTANPLATLAAARTCSLNGNLLAVGDDFEAHRFARERTFRKELERSWRVFMRNPGAAFQMVTGRDDALRVLATIERQQDARMHDLGRNFVLNDEVYAAFYRNLVRDGIERGYVAIATLTVGEEIVAALLGICCGRRYTMIRISNGGARWSNCSPGRLIIERTMAALHQNGVREFDFSIGNYAYKRRFGPAHVPLADLTSALTWCGLPFALRDAAAFRLRRYPQLAARIRRLLGKPVRHEETHT